MCAVNVHKFHPQAVSPRTSPQAPSLFLAMLHILTTFSLPWPPEPVLAMIHVFADKTGTGKGRTLS